MNSRTQGYLLLLFGGALLRLGSSDLLLRYVRPVARPWVFLAGAGLLALCVMQLIQSHRQRSQPVAATRTGWLVLAPVVAIVVIAPPALGSFSASRTAVSVSDQTHKDFPALSGAAPHRLGMLDFTTRVLWDAGRTVTGQQVELTGFVLTERSDGFVLARLVITCCAADARPVEMFVRSPQRPPPDSWVDVTGRSAGADPAQPNFPLLTADSVRTVNEPTNPYDD
jgi:uncharacterized repeat protein (TIGR03943 family)